MSTFTPPVLFDRPPFNPDSTEMQKGLFKYMKSIYGRYVSVFYLSDGTFVQDTATAENSNTNVPYPWNPSNPSAPYATSVFYDVSVSPPPLVVDTTSHSVWVVSVTNGVTTVSTAMAAALTSAGYGALIT